ncbi:NACHT domain-containing protein [Streptomyces sp. NPDC050658]|uniref:NACHT domain-containing protein n=1 Tax=unclassified Streptomyces TaxID=2593676 RepID=UPI00342288D7
MEYGGSSHRRLWLALMVAGAVLVVGAIVWAASVVARGGLAPQDTAGVVGLVVGLISLVAAVAALRHRAGQEPDPAQAAERLLHRVHATEGRQWRQLLGGDRVFIDLTYAVAATGARGPRPPQDLACRLSKVADDYRAIDDRRLVITGAPGAGKTVLALALLLALTRDGGREPVPVRLSLSGWNPQVDFEDWLVQRLVQDYDREPRVARDLVAQRRILPVLDGLDEMDDALHPHTDVTASRAAAAVERLDAYQNGTRGLPLVVTCRTDWYERLERVNRGVPDAVRIEIQPVTVTDARAYLEARSAHRPDRWGTVLRTLTEASGPAGFLTRAMSTPWRLTLAATAYADAGDPDELLRHHDQVSLDKELLGRYIPAAVRLHPRASGPYRPEQVHRWLRQLALHSERQAAATAQAGLVPHQLWPLAGAWTVRIADALLTSLVILSGAAALLVRTDSRLDPRDVPTAAAFVGLVLVLLARAGRGRISLSPGGKLRRLHTRHERQLLLHRLRGAAVLVLAISIVQWVASGLVAVVIAVLTAGLVLNLVSQFTAASRDHEPRRKTHPRQLLRDDLNSALTYSALFAVCFGTVVGYGSGDYAIGLGAGTVGGVACGMVWWSEASRRYLVFVLCARIRGRLPWRLMRFLDWAYDAGLLRVSGNAYQFRHHELRAWLLRTPQPP